MYIEHAYRIFIEPKWAAVIQLHASVQTLYATSNSVYPLKELGTDFSHSEDSYLYIRALWIVDVTDQIVFFNFQPIG